MADAIVISDIHLGSENCQAEALVQFLLSIRHGNLETARLILNGDVFDSIDFRRLGKRHWKVLSTLRKMSDEIEIVWITGNHDGPSEMISHLLGVAVRDEYRIDSGDRRILLLHGHQFDQFIDRYPWTSWMADRTYQFLQWLDPSHHVARLAKKNSKMFLRCAEKIEQGATDYAKKQGYHAVCCGHSHHPIIKDAQPVAYVNSGSWTERPCHYLLIDQGEIQLRSYEPPPLSTEEAMPHYALSDSSDVIGLVASMNNQIPTPTK